jgi:hypothetical protein
LDLRFDVAELRVLPEEGDSLGVGVEILEESVERRADPQPLHLTLETTDMVLAPCATLLDGDRVLADKCPGGQVLLGPRFYAPLGARLEVVHRLEGLEGSSRVLSVVGSQGPPLVLARSPVQTLEAGETLDVVLSVEVEAVLNELVVGLALEEGSPPTSSFRVLETVVTMALP